MRPVGVRDADLAARSNGTPVADPEMDLYDEQRPAQQPEWDFSPEGGDPIFTDEAEDRTFDVPGRPGQSITVRMVGDGVAKGLSRFARTQQRYTQDARGRRQLADSMTMEFDAAGLSQFKREHAIVGFLIVNARTGKQERFDANKPRNNSEVYRRWTGKFGEWVDQCINLVNGWDEEGEQQRERFPEATA